MKKIVYLAVLIFALSCIIFTGCSIKETMKNEEQINEDIKRELKAELREVMEAEAKNKTELHAEQKMMEENKVYAQPAKDENDISNTGWEESEFIKLSGFKNEKINGSEINYSDYCTVIVPVYSGRNSSLLQRVPQVIGSISQGSLGMKTNFAILGHMKNIRITFYESMDSQGESIETGTLNNANVEVQVWMPCSDMSYIRISGEVPTSKGEYSFTAFNIDIGRDVSEYEVFKFD